MDKKLFCLLISIVVVLCCVSFVAASDSQITTYSIVDDLFGNNQLDIQNLIIEKEKYKHTYKSGKVDKHTNYYLEFNIVSDDDSFDQYTANITTYNKKGDVVESFTHIIDSKGDQKIELKDSKKITNTSLVIFDKDGNVVFNNTTSALKVTKNITKDKKTEKKKSTSSSSGVTYWASSHSDKFHNPSCKWAQKISSSNKIVFHSRSEALNAGYRPCKVCSP